MNIRNVGSERLLGKLRTQEPAGPTLALSAKVDHLTCFLPGVLALGNLHGIETGAAATCCTHLSCALHSIASQDWGVHACVCQSDTKWCLRGDVCVALWMQSIETS